MSLTILEYNAYQGVDSFIWGGNTYSVNILGTGTLYESSNVTTLGSGVVPYNQLVSLTIGSSVTSIANYAFQNCSLMTTVTFTPTSALLTIGSNVFDGCSALASITIPDSVTTIGTSAFAGCSTLNPVTFSPSSTIATIGLGMFGGCSSLTSITIPDLVTSIGGNAFDSCSSLHTVTFSPTSQLGTIGDFAFASCTALKSITIPDLVTIIDAQAFAGSGLSSNGVSGDAVTIPTATAFALGIGPPYVTPINFRGATVVAMIYSMICYEANTLILILENEEEVYKKVSELKVGDLVKTYKQGYKKIKLFRSFKYKPLDINNDLNLLYKHKENGVVVTGGHSILVDELTEQEKVNNLKHYGFNQTIEDKKLLLACSSDKFEKIDDYREEYNLCHFSLESDNPKEHFGVYITDGILSESCPEETLLKML